jgi:hypothetical protein
MSIPKPITKVAVASFRDWLRSAKFLKGEVRRWLPRHQSVNRSRDLQSACRGMSLIDAMNGGGNRAAVIDIDVSSDAIGGLGSPLCSATIRSESGPVEYRA